MNTHLACIAGLALLLPQAVAQAQSVTNQQQLTTPKPKTPTWQNERDLIVLFENSQDRKALALQIMSICLDVNSNLTSQQRHDGLNISGHTLWTEGLLVESATCFNGIISLNISDDDTADAYRMIGQCHFILGDYVAAKAAYIACHTLSKQLEAIHGYNNLADLVVAMLIRSAYKSGDHTTAIQYTDLVVSDASIQQDTLMHSLRTGSQAALADENTVKAQEYLNTLLNNFPSYGLEYPGDRVNVELDLLRAQGFSPDSIDPEAVVVLNSIVQNQSYYGLPTWTGAVERLARVLDFDNDPSRSNKLRIWAVDQMTASINNLSPLDPNLLVLTQTGRISQVRLLSSAAHSYERSGDFQSQANVLNRIVTEFPSVDSHITLQAQNRIAELGNLQIMPE